MNRTIARFFLLAAAGCSLFSNGSALAQVASPVASPAAVSGCTIEPITLEHLQALAATATPSANITVEPPTELPAGEPAGYDNVQAFTKTIQLLVDCLNEGHYWRAMAVYSDRYLTSILPQFGELSEASYEPLAIPRPVPADRMTTVASIGGIVMTPDGRLAGIVNAGMSGQTPFPTLFSLDLQNDGWHVDEFYQLPAENQ